MATLDDVVAWLRDLAGTMKEHAAELTELDSAIGDADHGTNMARGTAAVAALLDESYDDAAALLKKAGMTLVSTVGGASGPLYGTFFLRMAGPLAGKEQIEAADLGAALRAGVEGIQQRGKAEAGDKTMYDAWAPALEAYDEAVSGGQDVGGSLRAAAEAAAKGRDGTEPLVARKGRASYLGDRSAGHLDPGAASTTLLLESAARTLG
ncbi:dihydroxyacetone kinase subunit DhaL [Luteipulveratus sp. YIM 133132]|uniref:dihydroxyacetone kinase subunit DhaL n=1 Tax=Luteipulveratus flavus TaxID=3031728 RepID=UPI0023AFEE11|nr:dihydroxyacetone kinase subunit DhaL [Luteipulveratus sp. YIM 133132]MDE9366250.1 dihydroxyacetone kinase subunit DhaL [Luteipulveratus sp. YIM 133132]